MAAKTLARSGVSLFNRLSNPLLHRTVTPNYFLCSHNSEETCPRLFPSFSNFPTSLHLPKSDAETVNRVAFEGFSHPCGLPSLRFFLPEGNFCPSSEPMLLFPKRTFQPSIIRRKRNHGFFARKATKGGRRVISRRIAKGRYRITA